MTEFFLSTQFMSGLVIGSAFGLCGGLLLGLVLGGTVTKEITGE